MHSPRPTRSLRFSVRGRLKDRVILVVIILAVAGIGTYLLVGSHAATPFASTNADKGTLAGGATSQSDTTASDGNKVVFNGQTTGTRGRPKIVNNTLVSDQGTLLRGGTLWLIPDVSGQYQWAASTPSNPDTDCTPSPCGSPWPVFAQYHLNTVRLSIEFGPTTSSAPHSITSLATAEGLLDTAVNQAAADHMYAVVDLHYESGAYDMASATQFWQTIASRYKDRTNVLYELLNEPVAWHPADYTSQNLTDQETLYNIVHTAAPQTPVIMMSFAISANNNSNSTPTMTDVVNRLTGVDWTNTAAGFHGYWINNSTGEAQLKQHYPTINTEFQTPCSQSGLPEDVCQDGDAYEEQTMERLGISWLCWDCNDTRSSSNLAALEQAATTGGWWWPADN